jgi:competence protein ComQ
VQPEIVEEMKRIVDEHFQAEDLKALLHEFLMEKVKEKSIWAKITQYCHLMLGGSSPHIQRIAALTELLILALDIIDDLQDRDNFTKPWMKCPQENTLNAIIAFIFASFSELGKLSDGDRRAPVPLSSEISRLIVHSINGQHKDLNQKIVTEEDYIAAVQEKSGSLLRFACYMGYSCIEDCDPKTIEVVDDLAGLIGVIAQIDNDVKDVQRYDVKNDLLQKKRTLPILYLLHHSEEDFPIFKQFYDGVVTEREFLEKKMECLQYIVDSGCIEYSRIIQTLYVNRAEQLLASLPTVLPWKDKFREITLGPFQIENQQAV